MNNNYNYDNNMNNEPVEEDKSLYNDGEEKKPKLVIIVGAIIGVIVLILIFTFACSKTNKKSENNYLGSLNITNADLSPEFDKMTLEYNATTAEDTVEIKCKAEDSKAYTSGCEKRIYLEDECVEHIITVTAQNKAVRKYELKICKQEKNAPVIKEVKLTPDKYTNESVKVEVNVESINDLAEEAYSFDGGITYQKDNFVLLEENKTLEIKVKDTQGNESAIFTQEITNIDKTKPTVTIDGSTKSGEQTTSNVLLTANTLPEEIPSGYKYQWYKGNEKIKGATSITYNATSTGDYKVVVTTGSTNTATSEVYKVKIKKSTSGGSGSNKKPSSSSNTSKVAPVIKSVSGIPTSWTNKDVTLKVTATAVNGLDTNAYSFDNGETYQKSNSKTFSKNYSNIIIVKDKKGNITKYSFKISKIDKTIPKVSISGDATLGSTLTASVTPKTTDSGYKYQWYSGSKKIDGATSSSYKPTTAGTYYVEVTTGSKNSARSQGKTVTQAVKPTVKITGATSTWTKNNVSLSTTISNKGTTQIKGYQWYKGNTKINGATKSTYTATEQGNYKVIMSTTMGDITSASVTVKIDKTSPSVPTVTYKANGKAYTSDSWTNKTVTRNVNSTDSESGISYFEYTTNEKLCGTTNGTGTKQSATYVSSEKNYKLSDITQDIIETGCFRAVDKAGNTSKWSNAITVKIDKTPPYTPKIANNDNNKGMECYVVNKGTSIEKGTNTTENIICIGTVASSLNLQSTQEDRGKYASGMSGTCDVVWEHNSPTSSTYGNKNDLVVEAPNYNVIGADAISWATQNKNGPILEAYCATWIFYAKRCYDKAGNVSNVLYAVVGRTTLPNSCKK